MAGDPIPPERSPRVGIVVLNYHAEDRTLRLLADLERLTWPRSRLEVVLVDNGSEPGFADRVRAEHPTVRFVRAAGNLGFGGGCNLGIDALDDVDYVALLNNDATPSPDWLEPLVDALEGRPDAGAATPKVLLDRSHAVLEIASDATSPGGADNRDLGVQLCGVRCGAEDVTADVQLVDGFWGWEHDETTVGGAFAWTDGRGVARVPVPGDGVLPEIGVRLACGTTARHADVGLGGRRTAVEVPIAPIWVDLGRPAQAEDLINNAGTVLFATGEAADRGYLEPDGGQFDEPAEVFGWSGAAVLLRRAFLRSVGGFEPSFFLYYEDTDLSWRGRLAGWTYLYVPASVVRHAHSATVGDRSPIVRHLAERNRLLMLVRCAPRDLALRAVADVTGRLLTAVGRDVLLRPLRLRRPVTGHALVLARILGGFVQTLPRALASRRRIRRAATVPDASIRAWMT